MAKSKTTNEENLPMEQPKGFEVGFNHGSALELPAEVAAQFDEADLEGFEEPTASLPFVSIRQKPRTDDAGKTVQDAGGFKYRDGSSSEPNDIEELVVTPLMSQTSRDLWDPAITDRPVCRSVDGQYGQGEPGVKDLTKTAQGYFCRLCPHSQWNGKERPKCNQRMNVLVYDHALHSCYVLNLGRSALKPWNNFHRECKGIQTVINGKSIPVPLHFLQIRVKAQYVKDEAYSYYVPTFEVIGPITDPQLTTSIKSLRRELDTRLGATIDAATVAEGSDDTEEASEVPPPRDGEETIYRKGEGDKIPF